MVIWVIVRDLLVILDKNVIFIQKIDQRAQIRIGIQYFSLGVVYFRKKMTSTKNLDNYPRWKWSYGSNGSVVYYNSKNSYRFRCMYITQHVINSTT